MTLPGIKPVCGDSNASLPLRLSSARRKPCLSAAWADSASAASAARRERRRAICSWSVGYGTLTETDEGSRGTLALATSTDSAAPLLLEAGGGRGRQPAVVAAVHGPHGPPAPLATASRRTVRSALLTMPGIKSLVTRRRNSGVATPDPSLPLVPASARCIATTASGTLSAAATTTTSIHGATRTSATTEGSLIRAAVSLASLRRCDLGVSFLRSSSSSGSLLEPIRPVNRLRVSPHNSHNRVCSRCSSLLTLASSSRYSLDASTGGFVQVSADTVDGPLLLCKLCLSEVPSKHTSRIEQCSCSFCNECMKSYVEFEIAEGAYDISCPDAQCPSQGVLQQEEIKRLVGGDLLEKHLKYRLNREVEIDKNRMWCPRAGCETVCTLCPSQRCQPQSVHCPNCTVDFCSNCKLEWHSGLTCDENNKQLAREGRAEETGIPFDSDLIKCCPMCNVPIEKDEGCAQMMCKRCKHVFCWYCLASLDDDFLLRHYDKGPCKNKLGHSRASVIWHRTQVIGIFAGFGILLLVASPLLLLAAPCIVCCKCRLCNAGTTKLDNEEELPDRTLE